MLETDKNFPSIWAFFYWKILREGGGGQARRAAAILDVPLMTNAGLVRFLL